MRTLAVFLFIALFSANALAANIAGRLDNVLENNLCARGAKVSILVKSMRDGKILYSRKADELMIPASNMKIVTALAALKILKPSFIYETSVSHTGKIIGKTLDGDLAVKGSGDPHLVMEDLFLMANNIRKRGISRISGNLVLDSTYFDGQRFPEGWRPSPHRRAYEAPIGALSFNFNSFAISIFPPEKPGRKAVVSLDPYTPYLKIENRLRTMKGVTSVKLDYKTNRDGSETVVVSGYVEPGGKEKTYYRAVRDPELYFGMTFKKFLQMNGVFLDGEIVVGKVPPGSVELFRHKSRPMYEQVAFMNKFSNNFMAEQILRTIAAETVSTPGTQKAGVERLKQFLISMGISPKRFAVRDGSGFARDNRLSASVIVRLLGEAYREWRGGPEFLTSLALMGRDGSVEDRLKDTLKTIRVKTGTLDSVSALSGYYPDASGDILAFSMIFNDLPCGNGRVWQIQHQLLREMENLDVVYNRH